ncbi:MAG: hypothetical protein MJ070_09095 [Lachnospiraceae bacterium]|nr:hypothetical protein [Lachnospiraceae bacterium]
MAVVVNLNGNHYNVSRIVNPDGIAFVFKSKEAGQEPNQGVRSNASLADSTSPTSKSNYISDLDESQYTSEKNTKKNSDREKDFGYHAGDLGKSTVDDYANQGTMAVAGLVSGLIITFGGSEAVAETVAGIIMATASVLVYLHAEGLADSTRSVEPEEYYLPDLDYNFENENEDDGK